MLGLSWLKYKNIKPKFNVVLTAGKTGKTFYKA